MVKTTKAIGKSSSGAAKPEQQATVIKFVIAGLAWLAFYTFVLVRIFWPSVIYSFSGPEHRLVYALRWMTVPYVMFHIMLHHTGLKRFHSSAINPLTEGGQGNVSVMVRVVSNTHESLSVHCFALGVLATYLPDDQMAWIPAVVIGMVQARLAFWIGYLYDPLYRSFGMSQTMIINFVTLGACMYCVWANGFMYGMGEGIQ